MYTLRRPSKTYVQKHYKIIAFVVLTLTFTSAAVLSHTSYASTSNTRADAWGTLEVAGTDPANVGGTGVDVYSNGSSAFYNPNKPNNTVGGVTSGEQWQCVEFVNRLYLTKGWTTATWNGNGNQLYANAPSGLTKEADGSITNLQAGDVISENSTTVAEGHTAVVASISGSTVTLINQNTGPVYNTGTLSNGSLTLSWTGYSTVGVIHAPASTYSYQSALNSGNLWLYGPSITNNTGYGMAAGTNPAITKLATGGYETAFQASTGTLWLYGSAGTFDTGLGMKSGTSPSITYLPGSGYEVAFQSNTGHLFVYGTLASGDTGFGMAAGTSPAVTAVIGSYQVAFNSGTLWLYGKSTTNTGYAMAAGTSPAITVVNGDYEAAFNSGTLWVLGVDSTANSGLGMASGSSPAITAINGHFQASFNSGNLWLYGPTATANTGFGMAAGTNPGITDVSAGYQTGFNSGNLWLYGNDATANTGFGLASGTSPSLTKQ